MATTAAQAWDVLTPDERGAVSSSSRDAFFLGFHVGWQAQENRPFYCTFCGVEIIGETDAETVMLAQDHTRACEVHPLAIENRELRDKLARAISQGYDDGQQALAGAIDRVGDAMLSAVRGGRVS